MTRRLPHSRSPSTAARVLMIAMAVVALGAFAVLWSCRPIDRPSTAPTGLEHREAPVAQNSGGRLGLDGELIEVDMRPVPFDASTPELRGDGALRFVAGFHVDSRAERFGGFSGLWLQGDQLAAVSDNGWWWTATAKRDEVGVVTGLTDARMGPIYDLDQRPVDGRMRHDAEEIVPWPNGALIAFEGSHRLQHHRSPDGLARALADRQPQAVDMPGDMGDAGENDGMEAVTRLADGRLLVFGEDVRDDDGLLRVWLGDVETDSWQALSLQPTEDFEPTAADTLPDGGVLLLERSYSPLRGVRVRVSRLAASDLVAGAVLRPTELLRLQPPRTVDNFEAMSIEPLAGGQAFVYLLSDDNFSALQRTLLLQLVLERDRLEPTAAGQSSN